MNIRVDLTTSIKDGLEVVFRSPVDCSQVTGLIVYYNDDSKEFAFADAHGNNVGDIDHLFAENVVVKVILDVTNGMAFVQNADTNAYIERTFVKTVNGAAPDKNGNVTVPGGGGASGIHIGSEPPTDENAVLWLNPEGEPADFVSTPSTASIGQTIVVKEVDENGKPTAWEAADLPTEGKWELIASGTMEKDARGIELTLDNDGNPFELTKAALHITNLHRGTEMTGNISCSVTLGSAHWGAGVVSASDVNGTTNKEFIAYANTNGSAWLAIRAYRNQGFGNMLYPFSDFIGKTITNVDFIATSAQWRLAAGLTYELWGVRK